MTTIYVLLTVAALSVAPGRIEYATMTHYRALHTKSQCEIEAQAQLRSLANTPPTVVAVSVTCVPVTVQPTGDK